MATIDIGPALRAVRSRIGTALAGAREPGDVAILAVTKGFGSEAIEAALAAGLRDIGENYYQEAAEKFKAVAWPAGARKHFIGRVQRNKARRIAALFDVVQTVDDLEVAASLDRGAGASHKTLDVLVQLNVAGDERQGVAPDLLADFARELAAFRNLRVRGLMAMGPADQRFAEDAFARAHASLERLSALVPNATVLSMGMSDDMEVALAHGSTMLRLGSALFGPRPAH
jgi:pyridoxal phosphate enzyme (YggS family)